MVKLQKTQVKIFCVLLALVFIGSVVAIALSQSGSGFASAAGSSNVGVVDYRQLVTTHPDFASAEEQMKATYNEQQQKLQENAASMSDEEKAAAYQEAQKAIQGQEEALIRGIRDKVDEAVRSAAETRGLTVVLDKNSVVYGGQDITQDVQKKISSAQ